MGAARVSGYQILNILKPLPAVWDRSLRRPRSVTRELWPEIVVVLTEVNFCSFWLADQSLSRRQKKKEKSSPMILCLFLATLT